MPTTLELQPFDELVLSYSGLDDQKLISYRCLQLAGEKNLRECEQTIVTKYGETPTEEYFQYMLYLANDRLKALQRINAIDWVFGKRSRSAILEMIREGLQDSKDLIELHAGFYAAIDLREVAKEKLQHTAALCTVMDLEVDFISKAFDGTGGYFERLELSVIQRIQLLSRLIAASRVLESNESE